MSDTPISDLTPHNAADLGMLCRTLERLAAVRLDYINQLEANNDAANAEIVRLTNKVAQLYEGAEEQKQRIHSLIAERDTAQTYADQKWKLRQEFHDLFGTDDVEQAVAVVRDMNDRIKRLEEAGNTLLWYFCPKNTGDISFLQSEAIKQWNKAKEVKL